MKSLPAIDQIRTKLGQHDKVQEINFYERTTIILMVTL